MKGRSSLETEGKDDGVMNEHVLRHAPSPDPLIRVLHVDDEPATLHLTKQIFEINAPYLAAESAGSAEEALQILERRCFDCIVSDYQMRGMNGIEFARRVKEKTNTPFIIYTGRGSEDVAEAAFAAGVDDYIRKEIDSSHLWVLEKRIRVAVEKRRAEDRLSGSEARIRNISEGSSDLIFTTDLEGGFTYLSPSIEKVTGYKAEELLGKRLSDFVSDPESLKRHGFAALIEKGNVESYQMEMRRGDGSVAYVEMNASLMMKDGQANGIQGVLRDVTERKKAKESIRRSKEQARRLLEFQNKIIDTAIVWIDLLDEEANVILWNRAAELISGYSRNEVIGHNKVWEWLYPDPDYRAELINGVKDVFKGESVENFESTIRCKDGTSKNISWYETNVLDEKGKTVGTIAVGIDATARKRYEERLQALYRHATELCKAKNIDEIAKRTFDTIGLVLGFTRGGFGVVDGSLIRLIHLRGMETTEYFEMPLDGPGVTVRTVKTGKTQLIRDTRLDMDFTKVVIEESLNSLSELSVPVKVGDEVVAVINIESNRIDAFTEDDQRLLEILAEHVASAIRRLGEQEEQRKYEERLEALHRHVTELGMTKTLQEVAERTFDTIERVLGFNIGGFAIVDGSKLRFIHNRGIEIKDFEIPLDGSGITVRAVKTGKTQLVLDVRKDEDYIHGAFEGVIDTLSELTVPIRVGGSVTAVINVESERLNAFTEEDRKLLEIFAEHVASTIRSIEEQAEQRRYEERLEALHRHASEVVMAKDIREMAESTFFFIEQTIRFEQGSFGVVSEGYLRFILLTGIKGEPNVVDLPLDGPGITIRAVKTDETQRIADVRQDKDFVLGTANGVYQPLSELAVPVKVDGKVVSVLNLESDKLDAFTEQDQKLIETLALHVASGFQRLGEQAEQHRYEERLETLHRHVHELGSASNMDDITAATFRAVQQTLGFDRGSLGIVEDDFIYFRGFRITSCFGLLPLG
jgi:PAS domain S-box-containing protein